MIGEIKKAVYASMKGLDHPTPSIDKYLSEYYHLKTLKNLGIVTPIDKYHPYIIDIFCRIEQESKILEAKESERRLNKKGV